MQRFAEGNSHERTQKNAKLSLGHLRQSFFFLRLTSDC